MFVKRIMVMLIAIFFISGSPGLSFGINFSIFDHTLSTDICMPVLMNGRKFDNIFVEIAKLIKFKSRYFS
jgi:hypothetical protein